MSGNPKSRPHPVASLEAIPPKWQSIRIDQADRSHPSDNFKHKFSVIVDEGCHLKVATMLFPMRDADLHRTPIWTELRDFYLDDGCVILENPNRVRVDSEGSGCQKLQQCSLARKVFCWSRFQGSSGA